MSRPVEILVTGFGPFPRVRVNPTTTLARAVAQRLKRAGWAAEALVLPTSYAGGLPRLGAALVETRPRAVLMLGVAARSRAIRVELFGRGNASRLLPDAAGAAPGRRVAAPNLPRRSTASPQPALRALRQAGLRASFSASAGRYLCDSSYALALEALGPARVPVLFVHVPYLRPQPGQRPAGRVAGFRPGAEPLARALVEIAAGLARSGRGDRAGMGQKRRHDP